MLILNLMYTFKFFGFHNSNNNFKIMQKDYSLSIEIIKYCKSKSILFLNAKKISKF